MSVAVDLGRAQMKRASSPLPCPPEEERGNHRPGHNAQDSLGRLSPAQKPGPVGIWVRGRTVGKRFGKLLLAIWVVMDAADAPVQGESKLLYEEPKYLTARIYAKDSDPGQSLFKFKRVATRTGETLDVVRDYTYPDGKLAAREHVVYEGDALVLFELEETQTGAKGSARVRRDAQNPGKGTIDFDYSSGSGKPKLRREPLAEDTLVGDMVAPFLRDHWDKLVNGEKVKCRYIVVARRETVGFSFVKDSECTLNGREVLILKMEPTSRILAVLVDPLFFTIEKAPPHHVLRYEGRTTPKAASAGKWKDLDAETVFDWK